MILAFLVLFDASCTHEINIQVAGPVVQDGQIGGRIILPESNKVDTIGLQVMSATSSVSPVNSGYAIDTTGKTSTTFLTNERGDILLMGYNYPGQTESNVSAESTALAFLMNTLTMRSLSETGKVAVIGKIKANPSYGKLVLAVENSLKSGKAVSDTTNAELIKAIGTVFESTISGLRTSKTEGHRDPIIISTSNTELQLKNNLVAHSYVAGIYKDGVLKQTFTIGGYTFFASGIVEGLESLFTDGYGIPESVDYPMTEAGEYEIKIRSGRPGSDDGTIEHTKARNENIARFIYRQIMDYMPIPENCASATLLALKNRIVNSLAVKEAVLSNASNSTDYALLASDIAADVFEDTKEILQQCDGVPEESFRFFKRLGKVVKVLAKAMNVADAVMKTANIYSHTEDLFKSRSAIDTCFQVVGLKTFKCGEEITYLVKEESGNNQKGESGKPLESPLKVKVTYEDGKPAVKAEVNWVIKAGGGKVSAIKSITNHDGVAGTNWTIGSGNQEVEAYVNKKKTSTSVKFLAGSTTREAAKIEIVGKNIAGGFTNPLKVKVTDIDGNPLPKVELNWKVNSGLTLSSFDTSTDDQGMAEATYKVNGRESVSLRIETRTDTPISIVFAAQIFLDVADYGMIYIHPDDNKQFLPNPFRAFAVDYYFLPVQGLRVRLKAVGDPSNKYNDAVSDALGLLNFRRDNLDNKQYSIQVFDPKNGRIIESRANQTIN